MENEVRLIDANALVDRLRFKLKCELENGNRGKYSGLQSAMSQVEKTPTVDAVEVVHGYWLYYSSTMQECSNCHRHTARHKFKYCPHCGAVMEDKYNDG